MEIYLDLIRSFQTHIKEERGGLHCTWSPTVMLPAQLSQECKRAEGKVEARLRTESEGLLSHLPLSTLNFSCRPFRTSISAC